MARLKARISSLCVVKTLSNDLNAAYQGVAQHIDFDGVVVFIAQSFLHLSRGAAQVHAGHIDAFDGILQIVRQSFRLDRVNAHSATAPCTTVSRHFLGKLRGVFTSNWTPTSLLRSICILTKS